MVLRFQIDDEHRRRVEQALARIDVAKQRRRKKRRAQAYANAKRRHAERKAVERRQKMAPNELRQHLALPGWQVLAARMDAGTWYTFRELVERMPEFSRNSVKVFLYQRLPRRGVAIDRAGNPDFDPTLPGNTMNQGGRYLYRLADSATQMAQEWREALGEG